MLADTTQAEPSRRKTHRASAILLGPSQGEGMDAVLPQDSSQGGFMGLRCPLPPPPCPTPALREAAPPSPLCRSQGLSACPDP